MAERAIRRKVLAYVTDRDDGRLLLFRHVDQPEVGPQVPGGSVGVGEGWETAVRREVYEETGLSDLELVAYLGQAERRLPAGPDGQALFRRRYYHFRCRERAPERWRHAELDPSEGGPGPIWFEFYWAPLPAGVPPLAGHQDEMLPALLARLGGGPAQAEAPE